MGITPNEEVLRQRLEKPNYSKLVTEKEYLRGSSLGDFYELLQMKVNTITASGIEEELRDYLNADDLVGLDMRMRAAVATFIMSNN